MHTLYLCNLSEGGLGISGDEQRVGLFQVGHLHVNTEPGDGRLWSEAPVQPLRSTRSEQKRRVNFDGESSQVNTNEYQG